MRCRAAKSFSGLLIPAFVLSMLFAGLPACRDAAAQGLEQVKASYTKYEYRIPMRDGKRLFTAVYVPKDQSQRYPILLTRTPYSVQPYGADQYKSDLGPSPLFGKAGYIFVYQDVRGRWMSEGEFVNMRPYKPVKKGPARHRREQRHLGHHRVARQARGRTTTARSGMWGISYPGFYAAVGMIDAHPALKAASPQAPIADWFIGDDWHHNGALMLPHAFNFMAVFGRPRPQPIKKSRFAFDHETPDGYQFFLELGPLANADATLLQGRRRLLERGHAARHLRRVLEGAEHPPAPEEHPAGRDDRGRLVRRREPVRGPGDLQARRGRPAAASSNLLVMGPWIHGGWGRAGGQSLGPISFNSKTADFFREKIELPFFEYHLKGKGPLKHPEAWVFETGTNRWRQFDAWPPKEATPKALYSAGGRPAGLRRRPPTPSRRRATTSM